MLGVEKVATEPKHITKDTLEQIGREDSLLLDGSNAAFCPRPPARHTAKLIVS